MRRPLKPFVTEYKGANRRQGGPASQPLKIDSEPAAPRQPEPRPLEGSRAVPPPQEDSYEAALRAADALFAAPPRPDAAPRATSAPRLADAQPVDASWTAGPQTADRRTADPWAKDPWSNAQPLDEAPTTAPPTTGTAPLPNGGRILRVIDEPPSPELLRLEAERAPKRRGRKPGSKNKPKPAPISAAALPASVVAEAIPANTPTWEASAIEDAAVPAKVMALRPQLQRLPAARPAAEPVRDEKYAWVRTKLKPGERWKRRLPKVAW